MNKTLFFVIILNIISASLFIGMYRLYYNLYEQHVEMIEKMECIREMVKDDIEFALVDEQNEIDKIIFEHALDFKTTTGEPHV